MAPIRGKKGIGEDDIGESASSDINLLSNLSIQPATSTDSIASSSLDISTSLDDIDFGQPGRLSFLASLFTIGTTPISVDLDSGLSQEDALNIEAILQDMAESSPVFAEALINQQKDGLDIIGPYGSLEGKTGLGVKLDNAALSSPDTLAASLASQIGQTLPQDDSTIENFLAQIEQDSAYDFKAA
jgi:hypothetical protein